MKKVILLVIFMPFMLSAQDQPTVDAKYFVGEDGKLYWHGKTPVYLFISDSPDGKNLKKLESQIHPQYTNPMYLDTEGINYIRSNWAADSALKTIAPRTEILFEVYRDNTPPKTKVAFDDAKIYKSPEGKVFYGKSLMLKATAKDEMSGVQNTFLSVDNGPFKVFEGSQNLTADKSYDIKIYSADNTGNVEPIQMYQFSVDTIAPVSEYVINGDRSGMIFSPRTTISLKSLDVASGVKKIVYQIDGSAEKTYSKDISLSQLKDGEHTITYFAYDHVSNREVEKKIDFYLDSEEPDVTASVVGDQYQNRGRVFVSTRTKVKLSAEDNKSEVKKIKYSIDGAKEQTYYEPFELKKFQGAQLITYYAVDKVNNRFDGVLNESATNRRSLNIDMEVPEIDHKFAGKQYSDRDTTFITSKTDIVLSATDNDSGVKAVGYKINGGEGMTYEAPFKVAEEGLYNIEYFGTDQVNNRNTKSFFFVVDNTGPEIGAIISMSKIGTISLDEKEGEAINVYPKGIKLFLSGSDKVVDTDKLLYRINEGPELLYSKPIILNTTGLTSYSIRAFDQLGNESSFGPKEIFVK